MVRARDVVAEWDEFLQGYDEGGRLIVCICGEERIDADWSDHFCPYDELKEDES